MSEPLPDRPLPLAPLSERPLVSVLMPNFNYARFLPEAIESVQAQTYDDWQLIVSDDGSTDDSCRVVERYQTSDPRIVLVRQKNAGQAAALNAAFRESRGAVLAILDADDAFRPAKLERVVGRFRQCPGAGLLAHAMTLVDPAGASLHRIPLLGNFEEGWIARRVLRRGGRWRYMPSSALAFRRELAELVFPIPERRFEKGAEGLLFLLLPLFTEVAALKEELSIYRIHGANMGGRLEFDAPAARHGAALMKAVIQGANERLDAMGFGSPFRPEDHLSINLDLLVANLLEGEAWPALASRCLRVARAILADDLYNLRQKLLLPLFWGGALLLPRRMRRTWLDWTISSGIFKRASRLVAAARRPLRNAAAKA